MENEKKKAAVTWVRVQEICDTASELFDAVSAYIDFKHQSNASCLEPEDVYTLNVMGSAANFLMNLYDECCKQINPEDHVHTQLR